MRLSAIRQRGRASVLAISTAAMLLLNAVSAYAGLRREVLPSGTVIPVRLNQPLSSKTSRPGDTFTVTVREGRDDAGLPAGTRIEGVVREALPAADGKPGVLDVDFRRIRVPGSGAYALDASLISLDAKNVKQSSSGRLVATSDKGKDRLKFIGIGAGAGLLIGALTKQNALLSTLLGAGAGYLYSELKKDKPSDVNLKSGTEFGVRLDRQFAFNTSRPVVRTVSRERPAPREREEDDRYYKGAEEKDERGSYDREEESGEDIGMLVDDRNVTFGKARPFQRGGTTFVPLDPVAHAAGFEYTYDADQQVIRSRSGALRVGIGSRIAVLNGERRRMKAAPELRNGTVYVPMEFIAMAVNGSTYWDASSRTVVVTTHNEENRE